MAIYFYYFVLFVCFVCVPDLHVVANLLLDGLQLLGGGHLVVHKQLLHVVNGIPYNR